MNPKSFLRVSNLPKLPDGCASENGWILTEIHYKIADKDWLKTLVYIFLLDDLKYMSEVTENIVPPELATHITVLQPTQFLLGQYESFVFPMMPWTALDQKFFFSKLLPENQLELISEFKLCTKQK